MWSDEETQDTTATTKMTKGQFAYEAFYRDPILMAIKTGDLRLASIGPSLPPSHDKAHYFDVEVATPNYVQDIVPIKRALRHPANWRPLLATKNCPGDGIERQAAAAAMQKEEAVIRGHQFSKLVSAWRHIQNTLADNVLFEDFKTAYATVGNEHGVSVIHAAVQRDAIQIADAAIDKATSDAFEAHVLLKKMAHCTARLTGRWTSGAKSFEAAKSSSTATVRWTSSAGPTDRSTSRSEERPKTSRGGCGQAVQSGRVGRVVVIELGQIDTLSPVVTGAPPSRQQRIFDEYSLLNGLDRTANPICVTPSPRQHEAQPPVQKGGHPDLETKEQARPARLSSPPPAPELSQAYSSSPGRLRNDGQPDLRYRSTQPAAAPAIPDQNQPPNSTPIGHLRNDGQPDMRFAANRVNATGATASLSQSSQDGSNLSASSSSGHMKADGTPNMRYKENRR
ncbi:Aste57867_1791 [Aphanomyces stellatus]|uniref:Aste57867_1791 protein n=1 Tax=Aphanomyces stellatus TaxID=120398 RepID=A0A485K5Y2_9STRA|nr:hypothetical protein As57867_001789 [Aphanomyces stellatus]VFT79000.1 Aste57867_1791 [Aphanomyces stellatus]